MIRWLKLIASMTAVFIVLVIVAAVGIHRGANGPPDKTPVLAPPHAASPPVTWDRSEEAKARRAKLIASLQGQGVFGDVETSGDRASGGGASIRHARLKGETELCIHRLHVVP